MSVLDAFSLSGKVFVVTGANRGIGRALVTALAEAGSDVVLLVRDTGGASEVIKELDALGVTAIAVTADVTEPDQVRRAAGEVMNRVGQVDVLVNNAGACIHRPALEVTAEEWRFVMNVNVNGVWYCAQEFGRHMVARHSGVIINIGSISANIVNRPQWQPGYNASKAAVHQLTRSLAAEWAPHGVRVNALAPGYIKTEMAPGRLPRVQASLDRRRTDAALRHALRAGSLRGLSGLRRVLVHDRRGGRHGRRLHAVLVTGKLDFGFAGGACSTKHLAATCATVRFWSQSMTTPQRNPQLAPAPDDDELLVERLEPPPAGGSDYDGNQQDLADRLSLRRVAGLSTELADITRGRVSPAPARARSPGKRLDQWQRGDGREFDRRAQGAGRDGWIAGSGRSDSTP